VFFDDLIDVGEHCDGPGARSERSCPADAETMKADCLMANVTDAALSGVDRWIRTFATKRQDTRFMGALRLCGYPPRAAGLAFPFSRKLRLGGISCAPKEFPPRLAAAFSGATRIV
jgi:hypothetical protein